MPVDPAELLRFEPASEGDGWQFADLTDADRFVHVFGSLRARVEGEGRARVRFETGPLTRNIADGVHGGYILAAVDQALFVGCRMMGIAGGMTGSTLEAGCQFLAPLSADRPFDAVVELLRETGRLIFLRGLIEQEGVTAAAFTGTVRKGR